MSAVRKLEVVYGRFVSFLGVVVGLSIAFFALSIPFDLFLRLARLGNIPWLNEFIEYTLYAGIFLAAPWVLHQGAHVRVDLAFSLVPAGAGRWLERGLDALGIVVSGVLCYYGVLGMIDAYVTDSIQRKTLVVYDWYLLLFFVVSMALVAVEFAFRLINSASEPDPDRMAAEKAGL